MLDLKIGSVIEFNNHKYMIVKDTIFYRFVNLDLGVVSQTYDVSIKGLMQGIDNYKLVY